jgi:hypothetical protein
MMTLLTPVGQYCPVPHPPHASHGPPACTTARPIARTNETNHWHWAPIQFKGMSCNTLYELAAGNGIQQLIQVAHVRHVWMC